MKILVVGGAGFVGSNIQMTSIKPLLYAFDKNLPKKTNSAYVAHIHSDLFHKNAVNLIKNIAPEILIVLAGTQYETPIQKRDQRPKSFHDNVDIADNVLILARSIESIRKVVYVSTDMVYGPQEKSLVSENSITKPIGHYGKSKLAAEQILKPLGSKLIILRPRLIVGPGRAGTVSLLAKFLRFRLPVPIIGKGENRYQMIAVKDLWSAIEILISQDASGIFNIGSNNPPRVIELIPSVLRKLNKRNRVLRLPRKLTELGLLFLDWLDISPLAPEQFLIAGENCVLDTSKLKEFGWIPKYSDTDMLYESLRYLLNKS